MQNNSGFLYIQKENRWFRLLLLRLLLLNILFLRILKFSSYINKLLFENKNMLKKNNLNVKLWKMRTATITYYHSLICIDLN